jgi:chromosome transmission fidelity protein 18
MNSIKDLSISEDVGTGYTPPASQEEVMDPETVPVDELDNYDFKSPSPTKQPQAPQTEPPSAQPKHGVNARFSSGKTFYIPKKVTKAATSFEEIIAARSVAVEGKARTSYYGIDIHSLMDEAKREDEEKARNQAQAIAETVQPSIEEPAETARKTGRSARTLMWTEKYRAKKFTDLVGDERTHRSVLRWLKSWDAIVFPGSSKIKLKGGKKDDDHEEQKHRKILLLTGPPGLGKTTLAHVCARQAGYEVQEINASDERSHTVVKGRIRDMVGTENVRGITTSTANGKVRKAGKPVCVVVDEVDGVVGGSGGSGEGGFIKALIDLINLDERNSKAVGQHSTTTKKRKGDKFRLLRPLILICNDVYHPSLRPLRQSSFAEIVHIRKPALSMVVSRIHDIFSKEGIKCDTDGVRRLCEATWGVSTKKEGGTGSGTGEGDIRSVMVVGEWVAKRFQSVKHPASEEHRLTRAWIEQNVLTDLQHGGGGARSLGRGGAKDVVDRVFREGAGFPKQAETAIPATGQGKLGVIGVAEASKRRAMERLREMCDTSGDCDRIVSGTFSSSPFSMHD